MKKQLMIKNYKNDWRPVTTTGALLTTTDVSLATTDALWTTTGDHRQPLATIERCVQLIQLISVKNRVNQKRLMVNCKP
jgi:hypothetical protein